MNSTTDSTHPTATDSSSSSTDGLSELGLGDPRRGFAAAVVMATDVMDRITPDQYDLPTPCEDMSVAELHEHLVMVLRRIVCAGRGDPVATWPIDAADVRRGEWLDAWTAAGRAIDAEWGDEVLDRPTELPWGVFSGAEVLGVYTSELAVHTWDLAVATGVHPAWDPSALEIASVAIHHQLPMADRAPMWAETRAHLPAGFPWRDPFGPAVPVADDASQIDHLVAWNGRDPGWTAV